MKNQQILILDDGWRFNGHSLSEVIAIDYAEIKHINLSCNSELSITTYSGDVVFKRDVLRDYCITLIKQWNDAVMARLDKI